MKRFDIIPAELKELRQWVTWRNAVKKPYQPNGIEAKVNDPSTWSAYQDCVDAVDAGRAKGVGFMFASPLVGIDLDDCRDAATGNLTQWADDIVSDFAGAYIETSMSGEGIHIICRGKKPEGSKSKVSVEGGKVECYDAGRYFALTADIVGEPVANVPDEQDAIDRLVATHLTVKKSITEITTAASPPVSADDGWKIEKASKYLAKMDPSIAGSGGHDKLMNAAGCMAVGFDLTDAQAYWLLFDEFNRRCEPRWSEGELRRKIDQARKNPRMDSGQLIPERRESGVGKVDTSELVASGVCEGKQDEPWPEPESIDGPAVPQFPVEALPGPLGAWVIATAEATQTPPELAALLSLGVCAGAVARRVEVAAGRGWVEPVNLYTCSVLEPGNRKSAAFSAATRPLRAVERKLCEIKGPNIARMAADREIRETTLKALKKKAATGNGEAREEALALAEELGTEPIPTMPKLIVDDATAEAVEIALESQSGRLIVAGAEGGVFDVMAGRYSSGVGNLDIFLKGHAGDDLRVDRVTRGGIVVERPCLTMCYAVQPEVIRGLAEGSKFRGRGLIGRFLYGVPVSTMGTRSVDPEPVSESVAGEYDALVRRLASIEEADVGVPHLLELTRGASARFLAWQVEIEHMLGDNGRLEPMRDWGGKLAGLTARLAAVLHLARGESLDAVDTESIDAAIKIARWSIPHAEAAIGLMVGADGGEMDDARYVLRGLRSRGLSDVTRRDVQVRGRSRFDGEAERLDKAIAVLEERGWIRPIAQGERNGSGRRPSPRYQVHPSVAEGSGGASPEEHCRERGII